MSHATASYRARFRRGVAVLGTTTVLAGVLVAPTMTGAPALATPSPATGYRLGDTIARDSFNRTGDSLGTAPVGGAWATTSPTGLFLVHDGEATWSAFVERGQTTHAWLPEVSTRRQHLLASFAFGLISRAHYGMTHRTVVRRQADGDGYMTSASVLDNGQVALGLSRMSGGVVSPLASVREAATLTTNDVLNVQTRVVGVRRVRLVARTWVRGTPAPDWQIAYNDSDPAAVRARGAVGINATMGSSGAGRSFTLTRIVGRQLVRR
jgi:hypothetical protein